MTHLRRPLVVALLAFLAGLLPALRFDLPPYLPLTLFGLVLAANLVVGWCGVPLRSGSSTAVAALFVASGAAAGSLARLEVEGDCRAVLADGSPIAVHGELAAAHRVPEPGASPPLLPLLVVRGDDDPLTGCGELRVRLPPDLPSLPPGTSISVSGRWRTFASRGPRSRWPADPRFMGFLLADSVRVLDQPRLARNPALALRAMADRRLDRLFPQHIELVEALMLGRREYVDQEQRDRFARSGLTHLLAISGMHVGLLAGTILLAASALRLPRRRAILGTLAATWGYLLLIAAGPSALRAGTMITLALGASLLQRPSDAAPMVAAAAFVILALDPLAILDPGLQLSFAGVLAILYLRAPLLTLAPDDLSRRPILRSLLDATVIGIVAFLVTAPIVAHHFGVIAPISIPAGIPAVPLTSLALIGALAAVATDLVLPPLAALFAAGTALMLDLISAIAGFAAEVPLGNAVVPRPPWWSWGAAGGAAWLGWSFTRRGGKRLRWIVGLGTAATVLVAWPIVLRTADSGVEVHFIDVGQGDAVAIRTPRRGWVLVDAGPASATFDAGARVILPFLAGRGARRLEALVLTHPDLDHIGGAAAILRTLPVRYVFEPGQPVGKDVYLDLLREIESEGAEWRAARSGRTLELDEVRFDFLWPDAQTVDATEDANQISAVLRVTYGEFSLLLTGDAGVEVEELLVRRHADSLDVDVLKLGHHGSSTSSSPILLDVTTPELAVVSAGRRNRYGHPAPEVLQRVRERGIPIARTDTEGTVTIEVARGGETWALQEW